MDSIYSCFLCDAEFNTSEECNVNLNVSFFLFFSIRDNIFITIALLSNF